MASSSTVTLNVKTRELAGSSSIRRLRREGVVPGVVYGAEKDPVSIEVDERYLRNVLSEAGTIFDVQVDEETAIPVLLKDRQVHPVRGNTVHIDLLRVNLNKPVHATVSIELANTALSPGVRDGGVLEHVTREINIEALPNEIPELIIYDGTELDIGSTIMISELSIPDGVTVLDEDDTVIVAVSAPRLQSELDDLEAETEVVGEDGEAAEGEGDGEGGEDEESSEGDGE